MELRQPVRKHAHLGAELAARRVRGVHIQRRRLPSIEDFVVTREDRIRLIRLPGYCPELNPDELLNQDVKTNSLGKSRPTNRDEMTAIVRSHLHRRQEQPQVIRNLFQEKHVRYAA
jgi:hypothetical protein